MRVRDIRAVAVGGRLRWEVGRGFREAGSGARARLVWVR